MTINNIDSTALECRDGENVYLGFTTGLSPRRFNTADTVGLKKAAGTIIHASGNTEPWQIERFIEHKGELAAVGPWIEGSLPLTADNLTVNDLKMLIIAVQALETNGFPLEGLYLKAFRRLPGGGLLLFPPKLAAWVRETAPEVELAADWEPWIHPDLTGGESWGFALGMAAWRVLTAKDPCFGETGEQRRERIRTEAIPSILTVTADLNTESAAIIDASLAPRSGRRPALSTWYDLISQWSTQGIHSDRQKAAAEDLARKASVEQQKRERILALRRWMRKSGWKAGAVAAVVALVVVIAAGPIRKAFETPITAGLSPIEVAEVYYGAIDSLDGETMADCTARGVGKEDRRIVDTIFVTHKVRQGYEGLGDLPRAGEWLAQGQPELPEGIWPWGITDLQLIELSGGDVEARYLFWRPLENEERPRGVPVVDRILFSEGRKAWMISEILRSSE